LLDGEIELQMVFSAHYFVEKRWGKEITSFFKEVQVDEDIPMQKVAFFRLNKTVSVVWRQQKRVSCVNLGALTV
jgi:hypothetical protein